MYDKDTEKFIQEQLKPYFKMLKEYDADEIYDAIIIRGKKFEKLLNEEQRTEFAKLQALFNRYDAVVKTDSFSQGLLEGIKLNDNDV